MPRIGGSVEFPLNIKRSNTNIANNKFVGIFVFAIT